MKLRWALPGHIIIPIDTNWDPTEANKLKSGVNGCDWGAQNEQSLEDTKPPQRGKRPKRVTKATLSKSTKRPQSGEGDTHEVRSLSAKEGGLAGAAVALGGGGVY